MLNARHPSNSAARDAYQQLVTRVRNLPPELQRRIFMQTLTNRRVRRNRLQPAVINRQVIRRGPVGRGFTRSTPPQRSFANRMIAQSRRNRANRRR